VPTVPRPGVTHVSSPPKTNARHIASSCVVS
jgi:hypothetical protein